jgi:hypothetical protein
MKKIIRTLALIAALALVPGLSAIPGHAEDIAMQNWEALPEDPGLAPYCVLDQKWSIAIAALKANGATPVQMMRWAEGEAEKLGGEDPLLPLGAQAKLIAMIQSVIFLEEVYSQIPGGFPQYAYRSCLKGKPITLSK